MEDGHGFFVGKLCAYHMLMSQFVIRHTCFLSKQCGRGVPGSTVPAELQATMLLYKDADVDVDLVLHHVQVLHMR